MRICEVKDCGTPVFGTCKISRKGYCKRHQSLREDFDKRSLTQRAISKININKTNALSKKIKDFAKGEDAFRDGGKSKSELLKLADKLFADFIKKRDTSNSGSIFCPCCNTNFDSKDCEVNCMHFIDRDVYLLRYNEDAAHAGHAACNRNQHYEPKGVEYQNFKEYLIKKLGETEVAEMEVAHRKINRIETVMLKNIIDHYS